MKSAEDVLCDFEVHVQNVGSAHTQCKKVYNLHFIPHWATCLQLHFYLLKSITDIELVSFFFVFILLQISKQTVISWDLKYFFKT